MSALGHKQTFAVQKGMSALPPIATAKAKFRKSNVRITPENDRDLHQSGDHQYDERAFQRPQAFGGGGYGSINDAMTVAVARHRGRYLARRRAALISATCTETVLSSPSMQPVPVGEIGRGPIASAGAFPSADSSKQTSKRAGQSIRTVWRSVANL
jgi:hypothetical protein